MSPKNPTEDEVVDLVLRVLDEANETRTEDDHPAPELAVQLQNLGIPIHDLTVEEFADAAFDLWERIRVNEHTVLRFADDLECSPRYVASTIEAISDNARADLAYTVRRHVGQPAALLAG